MGVSTDAYLFFGITSEDEEKSPEWVCSKLGWRDSFGNTEEMEDFDWFDAASENLPDGLEMNSHCSHECPMAFIAVSASKVTAWRGHPRAVDIGPMADIPVEARAALSELGSLLGMGEPKWWVASDWI